MYNKIFTKILDSSVWLEASDTRIVWVTLIASMDEHGFCQFASVRNLANRAVVPLERCIEAVKVLESPDVDSSDPDNEGRRIERVPGGWMVLNSQKHRDLVKRVNVQEQTRVRVQRFREKKRGVTPSNADVTQRNDSETQGNENITPSEAYTDSKASTGTNKDLTPTPFEISQIGKKDKGKGPPTPRGGGKKVKRETKKPKAKAPASKSAAKPTGPIHSGILEGSGSELDSRHEGGDSRLAVLPNQRPERSTGPGEKPVIPADAQGGVDETTEDTRPGPADAKSRIAQVLALVPGISLGIPAGDGGRADSLIPETSPDEVDPPALTPETVQTVNQRDRWQQLKLWLKQDLYMAGGAPINIQEVRFGTISPGESDYDYCFRDSYLADHEMTEESLVWLVGSENPKGLSDGLKKYSTRIQGLLRQIIPSMRVQLKVQPAEYERRLG